MTRFQVRAATTPFVLALLLLASPRPADADAVAPPGTDAELAALVDSVEVDSLHASIVKLQGFFTRHTNSDTVSTTVGIGAARRWVHDRFVDISNQNDGNLQVSYDSFTATVAGVTKLHRNVVATLPGTDPSSASRQFIICAHLDSRNEDNNDAVGFAPGACDDGSGVGALLEIARLFARTSFEATIKFIAFTGEEQGLFGSAHYAAVAAAEGDTIEGVLCNDIVGNVVYGEVDVGDSLAFDSTHVRMFSDGPSTSSSRQMARLVEVYGEAYVPTMGVNLIPAQDRPGRGSDHISFNSEGFTAVRLIDVYDNLIHQHTAADTFQVMNFPYYARNVGIDLATLGNLARAPSPVADVAVGNLGDSTGFRVTWSANPESDLAGYRVTTRGLNALQYETVVDLGNVLTYTIPVSPSETLAVGVAAYDDAGHLGIAVERLGVLSSLPFAPTGLSASPNASQIALDWTDSPEGDIAGYNIYRATSSAGPYIQQNGSLLGSSNYTDSAVTPEQFFYYKVTAVDLSANESPQSALARGRLVSLSMGVLLVEETSGAGAQPHLPSEAQQDTAYAHMLADFPHDTIDYDSAFAAGGISLSDLGAYSSVVWVADERNTIVQGVPGITQFLKDNTETLADYMDLGGQVALFGWKPVGGFSEAYPVLFGEGDFLFDYFAVCLTAITGPGQFFWGATGVGYPSVVVDTTKVRTQWVGKMPDMEFITAIAPGGESIATFRSSAPESIFAFQPVGLRYQGTTFRSHYFSFPLYHLREADGRKLMQRVLAWFNEPPTSVDHDGEIETTLPSRLDLRNFPNPGTPGTTIAYSLPRAADVEIVVFSPSGERVRVLEKAHREAGRYRVSWDGRDGDGREVASGVYFYRLKAGSAEERRKLVIFR